MNYFNTVLECHIEVEIILKENRTTKKTPSEAFSTPHFFFQARRAREVFFAGLLTPVLFMQWESSVL